MNMTNQKKRKLINLAIEVYNELINWGEENQPGLNPGKLIDKLLSEVIKKEGFEVPDAIAAKKWVQLVKDGFSKQKTLQSMWTLDWGPEMLAAYIKDVYPKEITSYWKRDIDVTRIMAYQDTLTYLRHIALHLHRGFIRDPCNYTLYLPEPNINAEEFSKLFNSEDFCPKIEIVIVGDEVAFASPTTTGEVSFKRI